MIRTSGQLLEWEDLKDLLGRYIAGPLGRAELDKLEPRSDREWLRTGDMVKLVFLTKAGGERMWVCVTERAGDRYTGTLDNDPFITDDLHADDVVRFGPEHVIEIMKGPHLAVVRS